MRLLFMVLLAGCGGMAATNGQDLAVVPDGGTIIGDGGTTTMSGSCNKIRTTTTGSVVINTYFAEFDVSGVTAQNVPNFSITLCNLQSYPGAISVDYSSLYGGVCNGDAGCVPSGYTVPTGGCFASSGAIVTTGKIIAYCGTLEPTGTSLIPQNAYLHIY